MSSRKHVLKCYFGYDSLKSRLNHDMEEKGIVGLAGSLFPARQTQQTDKFDIGGLTCLSHFSHQSSEGGARGKKEDSRSTSRARTAQRLVWR